MLVSLSATDIRPADVRRVTKYLDRRFPLNASHGKNNYLRSSYPDDVIRNINRKIATAETVESDMSVQPLFFRPPRSPFPSGLHS